MLTSYAALTFLQNAGIADAGMRYRQAMGAVVLAVNAAFVLSTVWKLLKLVSWEAVAALARQVASHYGVGKVRLGSGQQVQQQQKCGGCAFWRGMSGNAGGRQGDKDVQADPPT